MTIYGDEAGTMPLRESEGYFVVAVFASFKKLSETSFPSSNPKWPLNFLVKVKGEPQIFYINPDSAYEDIVVKKLNKLDIMARYRKLITGTHKYVTKKGIIARNYIWTTCIHKAIGQAILSVLHRSKITEINIVLDQKSLKPETELFFRDQIKLLPDLMINVILKSPSLSYPIACKLRNRINFTSNNISVEFNSDSTPPVGLRIAHYLASHAFQELEETNNISILEEIGFKDRVLDYTTYLMKPISINAIRKWNKETGLNEPRE
ncbi:MAG: hypothetical protein QQN41_06780 [Nitrosopumilus sp.]